MTTFGSGAKIKQLQFLFSSFAWYFCAAFRNAMLD